MTTGSNERYISSRERAEERAAQVDREVRERQAKVKGIVEMLQHPEYTRYFRPWLMARIAQVNSILLSRPLAESESSRLHGRREGYEEIINHFDGLVRQYAESGNLEVAPESSLPKEK
jgi:hypothetical protein